MFFKDPKIIIPRQIYDKVVHWCNAAGNREISGLGKCEWDDKTNTFKVVDAQVLKQTEQSAASTEIDEYAIGKYMFQSKDKGVILWWWHSHVDMKVFWSGTDHACIESFGKEGGVIATVFNKRGEYRSAVRLKAETMIGLYPLFIDEVPTDIISYYETTSFKQWSEEYEAAKVEEKKYEYKDYVQRPFTQGGNGNPPKKQTREWREDPDVAYETKDGRWWIWSDVLNRFRLAGENELWGKDLYEYDGKGNTLASRDEDIDMSEDVRLLAGIDKDDWQKMSLVEKDRAIESYLETGKA